MTRARLFCRLALAVAPAAFVGSLLAQPPALTVDKAVLDDEAKRVAAIEKVRPAVVAMCIYGGQGIGSGVLIDPEGYALTNYHVTESISPVMQAGLADGVLYDAVIVGQDKVGDVALVKLLPKKDGQPFPYVALGDSDQVKAGDWSMAMGNPFSLANDFTPTVTYGLVSGVNRYQPPEGGGTLEYTDCIQIDTSINPGNSGGPLFNMKGELIGINGRGSFEKRGRVNSGVGYAISVNQIKNFLGHLYAGIDTDHATLGATVETVNEEGDLSRMNIKQILEESDAYRRGIQPGDQLIEFAGRPLTSTNQFKNILGIFPKEWRLPISFRREGGTRKDTLVRLMGNMDTPVEQPMQPMPRPQGPQRPDPAKEKAKKSPAMKLFKEKKGFANYHFNETQQKKLWTAFQKHGDFTGLTGPWAAAGTFDANERKGDLAFSVTDSADGPVAKIKLNVEDELRPLTEKSGAAEQQVPQGSGGLLAALYQYRRLLTAGPGGFEGGFDHGGFEPWYAFPTDGKPVESLAKLRVDCDVLRTKHAAVECKWYFSKKDHTLLGCEAHVTKDDDPCELYFSEYKPVDGRILPHRIDVRYGDKKYGNLVVTKYTLGKK
jgi:S1-C subfamily serine protease